MRKGFMFYLNDEKIADAEIIDKLKDEKNISKLVRKLLDKHYNNVEELKQRAGTISITR